MRKKFLVILLTSIIAFPSFAQRGGPGPGPGMEGNTKPKKTGKEFTTSVIYGVLAGTLVGAATLAFTANPGGNLNNVARGASYGLYIGMLLGAYVTFSDDDEPKNHQGPSIYETPGAPGVEPPPALPPDGEKPQTLNKFDVPDIAFSFFQKSPGNFQSKLDVVVLRF